jgi:hypothetical protein
MNTSRRGMSVAALVVGLVVVAALVVGGIYYFSAPGRQHLRSAWKNFSEWTPDNIAKDPVGYLNFAEEQTKAAQIKLKASEIAIAQNKANFDAKCDDAQKALDAGDKHLKELRAAYVDANDKNAWPIKWLDRTFDREQAKKQIVRLGRECESKDKQIRAYKKGLNDLAVQASKVQDAKDKASEQITTIQTSREQLKVKAITDDLKDQLVAMKGVLQTSVVGVADEKSTVSIEEIAAKTESSVSDEEFGKIMGGK